MTQADSVHSTPPTNTPILHEAASVLDELAAGIQPDRARLIAGALALDTLVRTTNAGRDLQDAAAGLQILATGGTLDLDDAGRLRARQFAETVRQLIRDPIHGAIAAHQEAYVDYDKTVDDSAPNDENRAAFRALDKACRRLVLAEASTMAGLIALLRYMAPLLREDTAPALPLEVQFDSSWEAAFGAFCANVADRLTAIAAKDAAVTPEHVDYVGDAIIAATGDLFDDFEVVRKVARAAIEAIAEGRR